MRVTNSQNETLHLATIALDPKSRRITQLRGKYNVLPKMTPNGEVFSFSTWDLALDYEWNDVTVRLFSHNVNDKRYIQNAARITDGHIGPHIAGATGATGLISYTEYNQPRYTGFEIIYTPDFRGLD